MNVMHVALYLHGVVRSRLGEPLSAVAHNEFDPARCEKVGFVFVDVVGRPTNKLVNVINSNHLSSFADLYKHSSTDM